MKTCIDCKHYVVEHLIPQCAHPDNKFDEVYGRRLPARMARSPLYGFCGIEAAGFEEKPPVRPPAKPLPWWRRLLFWRKP